MRWQIVVTVGLSAIMLFYAVPAGADMPPPRSPVIMSPPRPEPKPTCRTPVPPAPVDGPRKQPHPPQPAPGPQQ